MTTNKFTEMEGSGWYEWDTYASTLIYHKLIKFSGEDVVLVLSKRFEICNSYLLT